MPTTPTTLVYRLKPTQIDTITVDVCRTEHHSLESEITSHSVEEGADFSDHSRPKPERLTLDCLVSNTPLSADQVDRAIKAGALTVAAGEDQSQPRLAPGYARLIYDKIYDLWKAGALFTVVTTLREYRSMAIQTVSIPRDARNSQALQFTISFLQVRVVKNKLTRSVVSTDRRVGRKVKTGAATTKATSEDNVEVSVLRGRADSAAKSDNNTVGGWGRALIRMRPQ
jgi:hypothetical protein